MKPIYRLTYLLLMVLSLAIILALIIAGKLTWIFTGKNPAMRWFDSYTDWVERWKKGRGV